MLSSHATLVAICTLVAVGCVEKNPSPTATVGQTSAAAPAAEAERLLKQLYDGARSYYMDRDWAGQGMSPAFPTSAPLTPTLGACCRSGGKCAPDASLWVGDAWVGLQFDVTQEHYYSYQYIRAATGDGFTARAIGDVDCDGQYSTFEMYGTINDQYSDGPAQKPNLYRHNRNE